MKSICALVLLLSVGLARAAVGAAAGATTVKVYDGKVLVSNRPIYAIEGHTKETRRQVPGPQEVSREQWETLVAGAMQMVRVAADGAMLIAPPRNTDPVGRACPSDACRFATRPG